MTLNADPAEVGAVGFFPVDQLPEPILWDHRQLIAAAQAGTTGHVWVNHARTPPHFADRTELYDWRDKSGLSREEAYRQLMQRIGPQTLEVMLGPDQSTQIRED